MAVTTQNALALQMIQQLRLLDPSVSAEVGTPERKILDTVAQSLYDSQVDLSALQGALDIDAKYGAALDRLLSLFGFRRQKATYASGYVNFRRITPSTSDIKIPAGTICYAPISGDSDQENESISVQVVTLYETVLPAGELSVVTPVRSRIAGSIGNLAAGRITGITGETAYGITSVTNDIPLKNGIDAESDDEYKVRFRNTVFRNLAGTEDQYLALAIATSYTSKANVVGPQSFYREYIQVPPVDDANAYDVNGDGSSESGGGTAGRYTTALSSLPFAKYVYDQRFPVFVTSGEPTSSSIFYRPDVDFQFNTDDYTRNYGDTKRFASAGSDDLVGSSAAKNRPNLTFTNVYTGANADVSAIRPNDIVLVEYSYLSAASRNDISLNLTNAVDVYIDGGNVVTASTVLTRPNASTAFVSTTNSKFYYENYRRMGKPNKRPVQGNILTPLYWQPIEDLPDYIVIGTDTFFKDVNYWTVTDVSNLGSTVRGRSGIEWSVIQRSRSTTDVSDDPSTWTGKLITDTSGDPVGGAPVEVVNYLYDRNIPDLQASLEGSKQITTDVLAHKAKTRWFKLDVSIMYDPGASQTSVNVSIRNAVDLFLKSQYFGSSIQLSDLLQVIHGVSGVDNVRWSTDIPNGPDLERIYETDQGGQKLTTVDVDVIRKGTGSVYEIQRVYLRGAPTEGNYTLTYNGVETAALSYILNGTTIASALATAGTGTVSINQVIDQTSNVKDPYVAYDVTFGTYGAKPVLSQGPTKSLNTITGGPFVLKRDWILRDDEQAALAENSVEGDTLPGMIIRPRAGNTWIRGK